jgi:hypothetical protein
MSDRTICIYYDPQGIEEIQDASTTIISDTSDYVRTYKAITDCLKSQGSMKVVIRNPTVFAWFRKLSDKYGEESVEIKEVTPCTILAEKWGFSISADVTDEEIIELNLLNFAVEKIPNLTFTDFILSKFVSSLMCQETIPVETISQLTSSICKGEFQTNLQRPLVQKEFERKIETWLKNAKSEYESELIELLCQNPKALKKALSLYAVLANYPREVGERAAGNNFQILKQLGLNPLDIIIDPAEIDTGINNIKIFLNSEFKNGISEPDALKIIEWTSGLVPAEFMVLTTMLERFPSAVTNRVIDSLQRKFSTILSTIQPELRKLALLSKPSTPPSPDASWNATQMLEWVTDKYLPYHFWLEETDNEDAKVTDQSSLFGDWLYSNFVNIRSNFPNVVYKILPNVMHLCSSDKCVLILVIDNFNYKFADILVSLLQSRGLVLGQKTPYLSMIPSDTEVSKRCLFAGQPKMSEVTLDYDSLIINEWPRYFPDKHFIYLRNSLELETTNASSKDIIFVNCTQIDTVLHQDERKLGKRHSVAVEDELENLVNLATNFLNRNMLINNAQIIVCSDHGSTMIPSSIQNEIEPAFFAGKCLETHHRFISISQEEFEKLPENVKFQCYFLDAKSFGLSQNALIAKGYYRFKRTDEHFFVHGGLSPEEAVVPLLVFEGGTAAFKNPSFRLLQNEFRYLTRASVEIEIVNENSASLEDVKITPVSNGVVLVEPITPIERIAPATVHIAKFNCRFYKKDFDETKGLEIVFEFRFLGKVYTKKERFSVQMRSMMETSFKLDEL